MAATKLIEGMPAAAEAMTMVSVLMVGVVTMAWWIWAGAGRSRESGPYLGQIQVFGPRRVGPCAGPMGLLSRGQKRARPAWGVTGPRVGRLGWCGLASGLGRGRCHARAEDEE
jgi:hypothetical protein